MKSTKKTLGLLSFISQILAAFLTLLVFPGCGTNQFDDPLTSREREWLKKHDGNITMALETGYAPFAFVDEDGTARGLATEYIELIEKKLNFRIQKIQFSSLDEILNSARKKGVDIVNAVTETQDRSQYLLFTKPFITIPNVIIVRKDRKGSLSIDKMKNMKVSLVKHYAVTEYLTKSDNELNVVLMPDDLSALMSVSFNRADAAIIDLATASYLIEQKGITNLCIAGESGYNIKLAIASTSDWPVLNRILEKGLFSITDKEKKSIRDKWISFGQIRLSESKEFWIIIVTAFLVFLLIIAGIMVWNRLLTRQVEQRTNQLKKELAVRSQSEKELKELELQLSNAMDIARLGHWEYDVANDLFFFNDHFYKIFGTTAEQVGGYSMSSAEYAMGFVHPEDRHMVEEETRKAMEADAPDFNRQLEHRILYADGRTGHISVRFFIDKDSRGRTVRTYGVNQDITERKRQEEKLLESEERFRTIFEQAAVGMARVSTDGFFIELNDKFCEIIGYDKNQLYGMTFRDITHPDDLHLDEENIKKVMAKDIDSFGIEKRYVHKDGHSVWVNLYSNVVRHADGQIKYAVAAATDISRQKKVEEEQEKLQNRLNQAQKMESIGSLAGGIAHDFNNILFPIIGLAEMLAEDLPHNSPEQVNARGIFKAGQRGADLVKQILAFSRQQEYKLIPVRIQHILKEVLKLSRSTIPMNIQMDHDFNQDCGLILADPTQIHQIAMNLITNAYHAVENFAGRISVQVQEVLLDSRDTSDMSIEPGRYALLSVEDNGMGIPPAHLHQIFDPYFTTKEQGKGTGLGLAVVYGIIKGYKGDIRVSSRLGKGTVFNVYLPLMPVEDPAESMTSQRNFEGGTERIFLIDDEPTIVQLQKQVLERLGYTVNESTSSMDALEAFKHHPDACDLVITDMSMPDMTGEQLAGQMLEVRPDIPIIICTGFSERMDRQIAFRKGFRGFLMKPVVKSALAVEIRRVLDQTS